MRKIMCIAVVGAVTLISGCTNTYDKEIDQVIRLENVQIKDAKKDIDKVERDKTCVKVYEDGKLIEINYQLRKGYSARSYYKNIKGQYKWVVDSTARETVNLEIEKPVYKEDNCE